MILSNQVSWLMTGISTLGLCKLIGLFPSGRFNCTGIDFHTVVDRAASGTSVSWVPDNRLGYPNPNFGKGTRNVVIWEQWKDDLTHKKSFRSRFKCFSHLKPLIE